MTRKSLYIFLGLALSALSVDLKAQDAHFSQYFASPLWTNPALTGQINGNVRLNSLYRSQWNAFTRTYQTTSSFSADGRLGSFGLGVGVVNQNGGANRFNTLNANIGASYDIAFRSNTAQHLVVGVQAGIYNISTNGNATLPDQYVDGFGAIADPNEDLNKLSRLSPDINFGLLWFNGSSKTRFAPFVGASAFHLLRPYTAFGSNDTLLDMRFLIHGGVRYRSNNSLSIIPHVQFNVQGTAYNGIAGVNVNYQIVDTYTSLEAGLAYRLDDALVPYFGVVWKDLSVGVSYDANISYPSQIGPRKNSFELSLTYINRRNEVKKQFICPRL